MTGRQVEAACRRAEERDRGASLPVKGGLGDLLSA
jgi:hypothetical protein